MKPAGRDRCTEARPATLLGCLLSLGLLAACVSQPSAPPPFLGKVLAQANKPAPWPAGRVLVLSGSAQLSGAAGTFRLELYGPRRYRLELLGPLPQVSADDGLEAWTQEGTGPARRLMLLERDKRALLVQAISGAWNQDRSRSHAPEHLRVVGADGSRATLAVDFPGSAPALGLVLDLVSGDIVEVSSMNRGRASSWTLGGWRELAGRRLPSSVAFKGNRRAGSRLEILSAQWTGADNTRLQRPTEIEDAHFDPSVSDLVQARRNESGHVFVPVSFGDSREHWFLLDTGASGIVIDDDLARTLNLRAVGIIGAVGGAGRTFSRLSQAETMRVGPLTIDHPTVMTLDLGGFAAYLEGGLAGILGWEFFSRAAVTFPAMEAEPLVRIRPPGGFDGEQVDWTPVLANDAVAVIRARIEDYPEGWFLLDTGAAWEVAIHTPWLNALGLPGNRAITEGQARGVVSRGRTLVATLDSLSFGGETLAEPRVHLALVEAGSLADRVLMGNIGLRALAPFEVIFDLANERMALCRAR